MRLTAAAMLLLGTVAMPSAAFAVPQTDLRDYALASCLIAQTASRALQTEGGRLADVVFARSGASPLSWKPLDAVVRATLAKRGLMMIHVDGPVAQATQPAPLASCLAIIESPSVQKAMQKLTPQPEPKRQKVHWDFLLEEMVWLQKEFTK